MVASRHIEKWKNAIYQKTIDWLRRCISALQSWWPLRFLKFRNPRWQPATILKNGKTVISHNCFTDFHEIWHWCIWELRNLSAIKINEIWKSKMAAAAILKNRKKSIIAITWPFPEIWHGNACQRFVPQPLKLPEFKDPRLCMVNILQIAISCVKLEWI